MCGSLISKIYSLSVIFQSNVLLPELARSHANILSSVPYGLLRVILMRVIKMVRYRGIEPRTHGFRGLYFTTKLITLMCIFYMHIVLRSIGVPIQFPFTEYSTLLFCNNRACTYCTIAHHVIRFIKHVIFNTFFV